MKTHYYTELEELVEVLNSYGDERFTLPSPFTLLTGFKGIDLLYNSKYYLSGVMVFRSMEMSAEVIRLPVLDSTFFGGQMYPGTPYPKQSYTFILMKYDAQIAKIERR